MKPFSPKNLTKIKKYELKTRLTHINRPRYTPQMSNDQLKPRHVSVDHVLNYFSYGHLPVILQEIAKPFSDLATRVADRNPRSPETTVALRKLLEAKDAAVRAAL